MGEHRQEPRELGLTAPGGREAHVTGLAVDSREVTAGHLSPRCRDRACTARRSSATRCAWAPRDPDRCRGRADRRDGARGTSARAGDGRRSARRRWPIPPRYGSAPSPRRGRRDRHQRQDLRGQLHCARSGRSWACARSISARPGWRATGRPPLGIPRPTVITLHRTLADAARAGSPMRDGGVLARAGPAPARRGALRAAGFTNFSQDHLDYHGTIWRITSPPRLGSSRGCCRRRALR